MTTVFKLDLSDLEDARIFGGGLEWLLMQGRKNPEAENVIGGVEVAPFWLVVGQSGEASCCIAICESEATALTITQRFSVAIEESGMGFTAKTPDSPAELFDE